MSDTLYLALYYNTLLVVVLFTSIQPRNTLQERSFQRNLSICLLFIVLCFITFRPLSPLMGDTTGYAHLFQRMLKGKPFVSDKDQGFYVLMRALVPFGSLKFLWLVIGAIYVLVPFCCFKAEYKKWYGVMLLLFVCTFSFVGYATNGLRNGIATSLIIGAIYLFRRHKVWAVVLMFVAVTMHRSALLPILFFTLAWFYRKPAAFYVFWIVCLVATVATGGILGSFMDELSFIDTGKDTRLENYVTAQYGKGDVAQVTFSNTDFRWDFMLYSLVPMVLGWYYVFKQRYKDDFYKLLLCLYTGCNAFWVLVIYQPYNNRFAYLSWFLYPLVIAHPLLQKKQVVPHQQAWIGWMIFLNYAFTYIMYIRG